ncbi:hypothetical protein HS088_TW07G00499 [Tripterygium wilfordii]|uniref:Homeobox domain-containing protein n=1 Tax=Tripterygium wilfordii TaxID=458696 RepID=A0A7J7DF65_TRIWF|nr:BEL1-like homeodomain protein 1 [Tripterygium wilfordii]XP_038706849.1 BEL1-like homeodomain protein 1 [Tripterygium wilfordii]XP_038706850.1 BEL1-like homeodomain protein 1 [Tripterygium wilfordii]KAF5744918.1 hypothetical protein HS088_TW07G00499 [Tripterygium wilfordii]
MTTYFYGSPEIQAAAPPPEGIQTLYLMNPNYLSYSDTPPQQTSNILFFNPPSNALSPTSIPHAPPQNHHLLGVPLLSPNSNDPSRPSSHHGIGMLNFQNNMWGSLDQSSAGIVSTVVSVGAQDVRSQTQQGLSLSLSSRQKSIGGEHEIQRHGRGGGDMRVSRELSPPSVSVASDGIFRSKYLRVIQELLDEVVNIGKEIKSSDPTEGNKEKMKMNKESVAEDGSTAGGADGNGKRVQELTTAQRQDLQMKKAKLVSMIDEVEQRYRQYHHQMQLVVSSFEQAAGLGSAKSYTALALQTISKQFRCLKDAISSQIKATNESLGDEDCSGVKIEGSRLKYVDHHLRQQRAIQQLGMIQHNPWRPQRGLPERAVSVLRAWLFEHFLHPYPKDSDKVILAKQTGLTRSQVSNWFINARVRLWKPMVEEMYLVEMKEQDKNGPSANHASASNNEQHNKPGSTSNIVPEESTFGAKARQSEPEKLKNSQNPNSSPSEFPNPAISTSHIRGSIPQQQGFNIIRSAELEGTSQFSKRRSSDIMHNPQSSYSFVTNATSTDHGGGGFDGYFSPEQLGSRFKGNGNVSLTLGLSENLSFSASQHNFMSGQNIQLGRLDMGITSGTDFCGINNNSQNSHSTTAGLEDIEVQNRKRFVAQLLPDFVA